MTFVGSESLQCSKKKIKKLFNLYVYRVAKYLGNFKNIVYCVIGKYLNRRRPIFDKNHCFRGTHKGLPSNVEGRCS